MVLDLMIHDLDLLLTLVQSPVISVEAIGASIFGPHEDVANARLGFDNGCVATVTASRASANPVRRMRVWSPEGYAGLDFARRHLTLVQPSEQLRRHGLDVRKLDRASAARLKEQLFDRYLQVHHTDCSGGDQLTCELQDFIHCVQTGGEPRVNGEQARDALALAARIVDRIEAHQWEGSVGGPIGPRQFPKPCGPLFQVGTGKAAA